MIREYLIFKSLLFSQRQQSPVLARQYFKPWAPRPYPVRPHFQQAMLATIVIQQTAIMAYGRTLLLHRITCRYY
jgi:hypothetical protein